MASESGASKAGKAKGGGTKIPFLPRYGGFTTARGQRAKVARGTARPLPRGGKTKANAKFGIRAGTGIGTTTGAARNAAARGAYGG